MEGLSQDTEPQCGSPVMAVWCNSGQGTMRAGHWGGITQKVALTVSPLIWLMVLRGNKRKQRKKSLHFAWYSYSKCIFTETPAMFSFLLPCGNRFGGKNKKATRGCYFSNPYASKGRLSHPQGEVIDLPSVKLNVYPTYCLISLRTVCICSSGRTYLLTHRPMMNTKEV